MKKMKNFFINNRLYLYSFLLSSIIIIITYIINDVTPFGEKSLLCVDFFHQYGPMMGELHDRILSGSNLVYSFNMGMGLPFFRNFLNYMSSPLNILLYIFPKTGLLDSYSLIIGLKAILASTFMTYYLSKKFNNKESYMLLPGIAYGFCAYYQSYYWNLMWIDGMYLLPLITLGIENIVNKKKWKFYTITLAIMLIANYFIGYMICIYSVLYFLLYNLYKLKIKGRKFKDIFFDLFDKCWLFAIGSLLAGCLAAVFLIPMFTSMESISATGGVIPKTQYYDFLFVDYLKMHLTGAGITTFGSDAITAPNISCGILSVACLLMYLINLDIKFKNKLMYFILISFFIAAFFYAPLDFILQAFHVPNDLPYRYSFIYSFILCIIMAYSIVNAKKIKFPVMVIAYLFLMAILLVVSTEVWENITTNMCYINMIILTLYFLFYVAITILPSYKKIFYIAIVFVVCMDACVSINSNWNITQVKEIFYSDFETTNEKINYINKTDAEKFFRIETPNMLTLNDSSWYGYKGVTTFSSMAYETLAHLMDRLGFAGNNINSYQYSETTPVADIMLDVKYILGLTNDRVRYEKVDSSDYTISKFNYNVGLGFATNTKLDQWFYESADPLEVQNDWFYKATGHKPFNEMKPLSREVVFEDDNTTLVKYEYRNTGDQMYYSSREGAFDFVQIGNVLYYKNDSYASIDYPLEYNYLEDYNESKIINIASQDDKIIIYVGYSYYMEVNPTVYVINQDEFKKGYDELKKNEMIIKSFNESNIEATLNVDENKLVYTSIPYDDGWEVFVDGKKVKTSALGNAFLSFYVGPGNHNISLKYKIKYFIPSLFISVLALFIIIVDQFYGDKIKELMKKSLKKFNKKKKHTK